MLKITRSMNAGTVRLTLSGRIARADLGELEHAIEGECLPPASIALDLEEVDLLDRDAVWFLVTCEAAGMRLIDAPAYVREWMRSERRGSTDGPHRGIARHE